MNGTGCMFCATSMSIWSITSCFKMQSNRVDSGVGGKEHGKTSEITSSIAAALLSTANKPNGSAPAANNTENRTVKGT